MIENPQQPPPWRIVLAFVLAPAIAAAPFAALISTSGGAADFSDRFLWTFPVAAVVGGYIPTLFFGLPAFVFLRRAKRHLFWICVVTGAAVAALPWLVMTLLPAAQSASTDGRATVANGHLTLFGLYEATKLVGMIGMFGAFGGATFWLIAAAGRRPAGAVATRSGS